MVFEGGQFYHVYNRGFNGQQIFKSSSNYDFFLKKIQSLNPYSDLVAYCLMPNHFHLLIYIPENSMGLTRQTALSGQTGRHQLNNEVLSIQVDSDEQPGMQVLSRKIGTILSSYTQAFNKQEKRTGSLFQPKTKAKLLSGEYSFICFHYIHQNPIKAGLCKTIEAWKYSSFQEYAFALEETCNKKIAYEFLDIPSEQKAFLEQSKSVITFNYEESSDYLSWFDD